MRKIQIVFTAASLALFIVLIATISAGAQTTGTETTGTEVSGGADGTTRVSQGTATGASESQLAAVRRDLAEEDRLPDYSQVVDDTSSARFDAAPGWRTGATGDLAHGGSYASSASGAGGARFKLKVPTSNDYALYAWWPSRKQNTTNARFGVRTSSGTEWTTVDQTRDGGYWVKIGDYDMKAGDYYAVRVSSGEGSGRAVADAVALVRGVTSLPPAGRAPADGGPVSAGVSLGGDVTYGASSLSGRVTGRQLIRQAKKHMGTPYYLSPPAPCRAYLKEDCSCLTHLVMRHFGKYLPDWPAKQWYYGHLVRSRANLRRGDLVFFKENGYNYPITHVAMYAGNGNVLHASNYFGKVTISQMKYINGYYGAKRVRPRLQ